MRVELTQRLFGDSANHLDLRGGSSLSWSEHKALVAGASASMATAHEAALARRAIEALRYDVKQVAAGVESLERDLGLRLLEQTVLMQHQVALLAEIAETLRTPARTRAAERIGDAGRLLQRERYERALSYAMQAIDDDPNNAAGFLAAAWASYGLDDLPQARNMFREAAQASEGDERQCARRQAGRLSLLMEGPDAALREVEAEPQGLSPFEQGATEFDRAVYHAHAGNRSAAASGVQASSLHDRRFCLMALTDATLSRDQAVVEVAAQQLRVLDDLAQRVADKYVSAHDEYKSLRDSIPDWAGSHAPPGYAWCSFESSPDGPFGDWPDGRYIHERTSWMRYWELWNVKRSDNAYRFSLSTDRPLHEWISRSEEEWGRVLDQLSELERYGLNTLEALDSKASKALVAVHRFRERLNERGRLLALSKVLHAELAKREGWRVVDRQGLNATAVRPARRKLRRRYWTGNVGDDLFRMRGRLRVEVREFEVDRDSKVAVRDVRRDQAFWAERFFECQSGTMCDFCFAQPARQASQRSVLYEDVTISDRAFVVAEHMRENIGEDASISPRGMTNSVVCEECDDWYSGSLLESSLQ